MSMRDLLHEKAEAIGRIGVEERAKARAAGVSSFYSDPADCNRIIEEKPDGTTVSRPVKHAVEPTTFAAE